ncbi:hypothetical protein D8674_010359 [Pyrus ussuriensis x Pyrus communis]|uniref:CCHC-type domain-containing protein n=1 Tax=Pyrus ussuriensis x Pyrus communis TaxID=2448454 RepID=A0A5N5FAH6_9ROSA|nr:hypothetical protein D8674_010359 [Pyrus ussuriensis x Pyrus communis]
MFSDNAMEKLCHPWSNALIIKLVGKSHTYNFLLNGLRQNWQLKGGMQLIDLDHDFYIAKFDLEEDREFLLTGGPWIIARQYLTIHKWRAGFLPATEAITHITIDINTNSQSRGKFSRICVEIDLTKPFEAFIQINSVWYNLEYKGMSEVCFKCGRYGHKRETCDLNVKHVGEEIGEVGNDACNNLNLDDDKMQVKARGRTRKTDNVRRKNEVRNGKGSGFNVRNMADEMLNEKDDNSQCIDRHTFDTSKCYPKKKDRPSKKNKSDGVRDTLVNISNKTTSSNTSSADANFRSHKAHDFSDGFIIFPMIPATISFK